MGRTYPMGDIVLRPARLRSGNDICLCLTILHISFQVLGLYLLGTTVTLTFSPTLCHSTKPETQSQGFIKVKASAHHFPVWQHSGVNRGGYSFLQRGTRDTYMGRR